MVALATGVAVRLELAGWKLVWARLALADGGAERAVAVLRREERESRAALTLESLATDPAVAAMRRLFKAAGTDPTRYRPSSEALLRRVLKGDELPSIHPLVDLNNAVSVALRVPACVMPEGRFASPVVLRSGREGETYESLRGPFPLAGKPLLADPEGPFGTPITDSVRVRVGADAERGWIVVYLPREAVAAAEAESTLRRLADEAGIGVESVLVAS